MSRKVKITLELEEAFVKRLHVNVCLGTMARIREGREQDPIHLLGWLVLQGAAGAPENEIWASTPMGNRSDCPEIIYTERRVYEDGRLIAGTKFITPEEHENRTLHNSGGI